MYRQTYLHTSASNRAHKKTNKKEKIEPVCTTKRHHSSFSYAIKGEYMRHFGNPNCK